MMADQQMAQQTEDQVPAVDAPADTAATTAADAVGPGAAPGAGAADAGLMGFDGLITWVFIGLGVLVLILVIVLAVWLWRSRAARKAAESDDGPAEPADEDSRSEIFLSPSAMRRSFRQGLAIYREYVAGSRNLYLVPWFITVGEVGAGKSTLLGSLDSNRAPAETLDEQTGRAAGCTWWYYDDAVVLDIGGESILRADGTSVPDLAWQRILGLLQKYRGRRPADGIILTIPATDLWGPNRLGPAEVSVKARAVYAKLWQAQKVLGLCLPVYVVITKCDTVPGFSAFARALPGPRQGDMLGWSSSQATDAAFRPERVDEAMAAIDAALFEISQELFTEGRVAQDAEEVFLLPRRLRQMQEPLRQYLATVFRRTAYHESLFLRGIYLVGDPQAVHVAATDGDAALDAAEPVAEDWSYGTARRLAFVRDLFDRKIFREVGLVRPTPRWSTVHSRRRLLVNAALALVALIAVGWVWLGGTIVAGTVGSLQPTIAALPDRLNQARRDKLGEPDGAVTARTIEDLAREYTRIADTWDTAFYPANWFSSLHERTTTALSLGYYKVLLSGVRTGLHHKGRQITEGLIGDGDPHVRPAALGRLSHTVDSLADFEGAVALFNGINGSNRLAGVDILTEYAVDAALPPAFLDRAATYGFTVPPDNAALRGVGLQEELRPFSPDVYAAAARLRVLDLAKDYFRSLAGDEELAARLNLIVADIGRLTGEIRRSEDPRSILERLHANLDFVAGHLGSAEATWVGLTELSFSPEMENVLERIAASQLLGPQVRDELVGQARAAFAAMSSGGGLPDVDTAIGRLLDRDASGRGARLSASAEDLRKALREWRAMSFMAAGEAYQPTMSLALGQPAVWDLDTLDGGMALTEDYLLFEVDAAKAFPEPLRPVVRSVSRQSVAGGMLVAVANAQVPYAPGNSVIRQRAEHDLRVQVRSFDAAAPTLVQMLQTLDQIAVPLHRDQLFNFVGQYAGGLLTRVDALLSDDNLYTPKQGGFAWWQGGSLMPHEAFGLAEPPAVPVYLADMRRRVSILAHDLAEPVVELLYQPVMAGGGSYVPALDKWAEILVQLDRYENARPSSALGALEQFIAETMPTIDLASCTEVLKTQPLHTSGGFFRARLSGLARMIEKRCDDLLYERVVSNYKVIGSAFNDMLAGRYPFTDTASGDAGAINGPQAGVESVRAFYRVFDGRAAEIMPFFAAGGRYGAVGEKAYWFLADMQRARDFFAPLLGAEALAGRSAYAVQPEFRTNRRAESGGNEIIEWTLMSGDQSVNNFGAAEPVPWRVGEPLELRLRWAKDGGTVPVGTTSSHGAARPDAGTVTFRYSNPWALVSMIQSHGVQLDRLRQEMARLPHMLALEAETRPVGAAEGTLPTDRARVFVSLAVSGVTEVEGKPAQIERLVLPRFPDRAPALFPSEELPRMSMVSPAATPVPPPAPVDPAAPTTLMVRPPEAPPQATPERAVPAPLAEGPSTWMRPRQEPNGAAPADGSATVPVVPEPDTGVPSHDRGPLLLTPDVSAGRE